MKVEVISRDIIKPSSPTPESLRNYQLSFLDQVSPRTHSPFIYYYSLSDINNESNDNNVIADISYKLKKSLSKTLTLYYPLAGRFTKDFCVDCHDDGAPFFEARVLKRQLSDIIKNPVPLELNDLLPFPLDEYAGLPFGVQLNIFPCGGITIGVCIAHQIADALSCLEFTKCWMAIARGEENKVVRPTFVSASLFPPKNIGDYDPTMSPPKMNTNVAKLFVLDARKVEALRAKYEEKARGENHAKPKWPRRLSRVEALSAFLWSRYVVATDLDIQNKLCTIFHPVNIRPKFDKPLPENSFGNYYIYQANETLLLSSIISSNTTEEEKDNCYELAWVIGEEIRKIDKNFVEDLHRVEKSDEYFESLKKGTERSVRGEGVALSFSSLCRFPLYDADFGYGKPIWVSSADRCFSNIFVFMDNKTGDEIETYACFSPEEMAKFEVDKEFLSLLSRQIE
ncbi:stemmadenine O-acetyltransferase-like [Humulus lupulus]|uniref:stemmadenine O-acetyltransferase-like n=1 Tax=Humulus lupulus TaxID=3486 RepID=UPI002B409ABF|nr:stemmadenine O-acetyltransferase-like [Humulus lupulus]